MDMGTTMTMIQDTAARLSRIAALMGMVAAGGGGEVAG